MSAGAKETFIPNASHGDFWKGFMVDGWFYKAMAIFPITGFLGIDKFVLRSPSTAIFKLLINIFFLGAWYVYDIIQLLTDDEFVGKYGFSNIYGVSGHGYRLLSGISESKVDEYANPSPYNGGFLSAILYLGFLFTTITFGFTGLPMMIAGDFYGGLVKLFSNFLILPFVFYLVSQFIDFFKSGSLEKDGVSHPWPMYPMFTIFEKYPATYLLSSEQAKKELQQHNQKYEADIKAGTQPVVPAFLTSIFGKVFEAAKMYPPIAAFDTITAAKGAVSATSDMAQSAAKVGKQLATAMEQRITKDPNAVLDSFLGTSEDPITGARNNASPLPNEDPSTLATNTVLQKGGALDILPEGLDTIMLIGMGVLVVGGFAAALLRKFSLPKRQEDNEYPRKTYERDDAPPKPGGV
jgi:hypothetical protein